MKTVFSTEQVHPRDGFDLWMSAIRQNLINNHAEPARRYGFRADLQSGSVGGINVALLRSSALVVRHTARHASRIASDAVFLFAPLAGSKFVEQAGRQAYLNRGDFALVDPTMPIDGRFTDDCQLLVLSIERKQLESRLGNIRDLTARPINATTMEAKLTSDYLALLPSYATGLELAAERSVEAHLLDLVALSISEGRQT